MAKRGRRALHEPSFKAKVALAAVREMETAQQLGSRFGINPVQVRQWKKRLVDGAAEVFAEGAAAKERQDFERREAELFEQVGRLKMELAWLQKKVGAVAG